MKSLAAAERIVEDWHRDLNLLGLPELKQEPVCFERR